MKTLETVTADALELSLEDRLALAEKMVLSIPADPEIEKAWEQEIQRRIHDYDSGKVKGIPVAEVFAKLDRKLSQ